MKKELCAAALLLLLIAASAINVLHVEKLTGKILDSLTLSQQAMDRGDSDNALEHWQTAFMQWESSYSYSHIFIRHTEIDATAESFYSLKELILGEESEESAAAYEELRYRLECIALMEKPSLGSVF